MLAYIIVTGSCDYAYTTEYSTVTTESLKGQFLGHLFLMYVDDLEMNIKSKIKC